MQDKLILRAVTSPYGDDTKNSVLSHEELDNNLIFLKGETIFNGSTSGTTLVLTKLDNTTVNIDLIQAIAPSSVTGGTFDPITGVATFTNLTGGTFPVSGFSVNVNFVPNTGIAVSSDTNNSLYTIYNTKINPSIESVAVGGAPAGISAATWSTKTLVEVLDTILFPDVNPTYTPTTTQLVGISTVTQEIGTSFPLDITVRSVKNDAGDYTYSKIVLNFNSAISTIYDNFNPNGIITAPLDSQFGYEDPNTTIGTPNLLYQPNYTDGSYVIPEPTNPNARSILTFYGSSNYVSGLPKLNNKGVADSRTPLIRNIDAPQSAETDFRTASVVVTGLYPVYYGNIDQASRPINSQIVGIINGGTAQSTLTSAQNDLTITFTATTDQYLWFAYYDQYPSKTSWYATALNSGDIGGSGNLFDNPITSSVNSPNSYWSNKNFKFYITNYKTKFDVGVKFSN